MIDEVMRPLYGDPSIDAEAPATRVKTLEGLVEGLDNERIDGAIALREILSARRDRS